MSAVPFRNQRYNSLKKDSNKKGELYVDHEFPAHNKSIFFSKIDADITWQRPHVSVSITRMLFCMEYSDFDRQQ